MGEWERGRGERGRVGEGELESGRGGEGESGRAREEENWRNLSHLPLSRSPLSHSLYLCG
jgi:hypothetical protein